ncbi:MAG TPA: ABC transporter ATP-binding protein [Rectinemataceae bacterium]|nr:ABC transporter ATP-binding protein [Rectinemataceae bacterium]
MSENVDIVAAVDNGKQVADAAGEHKVAIRFSDVGFSHGPVEVLRNTSFHVHSGEFVALIGPNGSGKTTILRLIMGLSSPQSGKIEVFGKSPDLARGSIGYVPQYMNFDQAFPISVEEVVKMGRLEGFGRGCMDSSCPDIGSALELAGVADLRKRSYTALSGGQRRRVLVARALASAPRLLILDEPTANMDAESEQRLFSVLGNLKGTTTILIATHDTAFVSALTDVVLCVGEQEGVSHGLHRHAAGPAEHIPSNLYGGTVLQVLHDTELPDDACCTGRDRE